MSSEEMYKETIRLKIERLIRQNQNITLINQKKDSVSWFIGEDGKMTNEKSQLTIKSKEEVIKE